MEDPELLTPIDLQDSYFDYVVQGEDAHSHVLSLIIQNTEQKYLLTLDLSDGGVAITTGEMSEDVPPERYPKLCEQMLGSLSLIADTLVIAA